MLIAHQGAPLAPHDLWWAWSFDPLLMISLALLVLAYLRGRRPRSGPPLQDWRAVSFGAGITVLAVALLSPLDALSGELASAHMVQHVLLSLIAPPLLVLGAAGHRALRGTPATWRRTLLRWQRRGGLTPKRVQALRSAALAWLLSVGALWFWHGAVPYQAALRHDTVHAVEHACFFVTGLLFWRSVVPRRAGGAPGGYGVLLLFAMATQSGLLAALLTFARTPWYEAYATSSPRWGLDPLADQQLAGVIMWVPAGAVYAAAALALVVAWLRHTEAHPPFAASNATAESRPA